MNVILQPWFWLVCGLIVLVLFVLHWLYIVFIQGYLFRRHYSTFANVWLNPSPSFPARDYSLFPAQIKRGKDVPESLIEWQYEGGQERDFVFLNLTRPIVFAVSVEAQEEAIKMIP